MAGIAELHKGRYDSPLCRRLIGVNINQDEDPWWVVGILNWLGMVHAIQQATGEQAAYREDLKAVLEYGKPYMYVNTKATGERFRWLYGPEAVYGVYQSYVNAVEAAMNK